MRSKSRSPALLCAWPILAFAILTLSACAGLTDPYKRPGTWDITGSNDTNLQAMVATPGDLEEGHGDGLSTGQAAAAAIARLRSGHVYPLPDTALSDVKVSSSGSGSGGTSGGTQ